MACLTRVDGHRAIPLMTFQKLVFLDFDGVLHPGLAGTFIYLPDFEEWLRPFAGVGVVLSSTWRLDNPLSELLRLFSSDLRPRVVGTTPEVTGGPAARYLEIQEWLRSHAFNGTWAALDDDTSLFPLGLENLVLCATARGLRKPQLAELTRKLGC